MASASGSLTAVGRSLPVSSLFVPVASLLVRLPPVQALQYCWRIILFAFLAYSATGKARARLQQLKQKRLEKAVRKGRQSETTWQEVLGGQGTRTTYAELGLVAATSLVGVLVSLYRDLLNGQFYMAQNSGDRTRLKRLMWLFPVTTLASALVSQITETCKAWVALSWRRSVIYKIHDLYFDRRAYYHVLNQQSGLGVPDADARICNDVREACDAYAGVMSGAVQTSVYIGMQYSTLMARIAWIDRSWVFGPPLFVLGIVPTFLGMVNWHRLGPIYGILQHFGSAYGQVLTRVQLHGSGICMLHGEGFEHDTLKYHLGKLVSSFREMLSASFHKDFIESFLFSGLYPSGFQTLATFTAAGITSSELLLRSNPSDIEKMGVHEPRPEVSAYFGGYIHNWWSVVTATGTLSAFLNTWYSLTEGQVSMERVMSLFASMQAVRESLPEAKEGAFQDLGAVISFDSVTVVTPAGQTLLRDLSFSVKPGDRLLICGHNGAGKSSIMRCLSALWTVPKGTIARPGGTRLDSEEDEGLHSQVYYLPQKPCSVIGTLSDQLTYPQRLVTGLPAEELRGWLRCVDLEYLADRDAGQLGGLGRAAGGENEVDWEQLLSLGEQQALSFARLFYHHPEFAILDECTSAVSSSMEHRLFEMARRLGITCITITHRPALQALHSRMLRLTGRLDADQLGWELQDIPHDRPLPPVDPRVSSRQEALARATDFAALQQQQQEAPTATVSAATEQRVPERAPVESPSALVRRRWPGSLGRFVALLRLGLQEPGQATRLGARLSAIAGGMWVHCALLWQVWAGQNGAISAALTGRTDGILAELLAYFMTAPLISWVDTMIKYQGRMLASEISESISQRLLRMAFTAGSFVTVMRPGSPLHVENPMTRLSELNTHLATVSSTLVELLFRCSFGLYSLRTLLRGVGPIAFLSPPTYFLIFRLCLFVAPDFVYLSKREAELESRFQVWHTRLRHVAEPVAFSGGGPAERRAIEPHFDAVLDFRLSSLRQKFFYRFVENLFTGHSEIPLYMQRLLTGQFSSRNVAYNPSSGVTPAVVVQNFMFERVVMYNDNTAHRLGSFTPTWRTWDGMHVRLLEVVTAFSAAAATDSTLTTCPDVDPIQVQDLNLVSPAGRCLAKGLTFSVHPGSGLVVSGPNGCGKTLLGAVLMGLWPVASPGVVRMPGLQPGASRPPLKLIMAAPQRLYLPMGTLGDQVCYPDRYSTASGTGVEGGTGKEDSMADALQAAGIAYLLGRDPRGWLQECRWEDVLSGGEQQRMSLARVLYQRPTFALLDECTSMVAHDSEEGLYKALVNKCGVTPITLSQRLCMPDTHTRELQLGRDGAGGWALLELGKQAGAAGA